MPPFLSLADRDSPDFEARRAAVDVVCAGDSITGWNNFRRHEPDWPFCSYPEFLQELCGAVGLNVADCGIAGEVSPNGVGQVSEYLRLFPNARSFVVGFGANDLDRWPDLEETSPRVIGNLGRMAEAVRGDGRSVLLIDLLNFDESRVPPDEAGALRRMFVEHNRRLRDYCASLGIPLVENFGKLGPGDFSDPFHPNESGARIIAREVFQSLNGLRGFETLTP
ncbi:MAG: SGNH/GDSL hydrolase family protein [Isosphaeraceae bacterium]